jgi:hypothetical protein
VLAKGNLDSVEIFQLEDFMYNSFQDNKPKQPLKCRGCIWGNWDQMKQFCSKPICIKEPVTK